MCGVSLKCIYCYFRDNLCVIYVNDIPHLLKTVQFPGKHHLHKNLFRLNWKKSRFLYASFYCNTNPVLSGHSADFPTTISHVEVIVCTKPVSLFIDSTVQLLKYSCIQIMFFPLKGTSGIIIPQIHQSHRLLRIPRWRPPLNSQG